MSEVSVAPIEGKAITFKGKGGVEILQYLPRTVRAPGEGEVRIRVKAAAVNPTDVLLRIRGVEDDNALVVPGMDFAGVIESVGPGVSRLKVGDAVMGVVLARRPDGGAQSQYVVAPHLSVSPMPAGTSFAAASTLPMNGLTALRALEVAGLEEGQALAVSGGAGLLAQFVIAIAKQRGLTVIADAKASDVQQVKDHGADIVVERGPDFANAVRRAVPEGVDALIDTAVLGEQSFAAVRDGGTYIPLRGWADKPMDERISIKPFFVSEALDRVEWLEQLNQLVSAGAIKLRETKEFTPEKIAEAQSLMEAGGLRDRAVIMF